MGLYRVSGRENPDLEAKRINFAFSPFSISTALNLFGYPIKKVLTSA